MCSYFILRPVRDEMGIQSGVQNMQWLFTGTFLVMLLIVPLFGFLTAKYPRTKLVPAIYIASAVSLLIFYLLFSTTNVSAVSIAFYIWLSVLNMFVISIFWSFNADIFDTNQAKRVFAPIAAGGSTGAIVGPVITSMLVSNIGVINLLLISAILLLLSTYFITRLIKERRGPQVQRMVKPLGGDVWAGLKKMIKTPMLAQIALFILLYTSISTFLYFEQAHIVSEAYASSEERTSFFGTRDLLVNILTLVFQVFLTEKILRNWGLNFCLILVPVVGVVGFLLLGLNPSVYVLLVVQVLYRSLSFSVQRPSRELLFTSVSEEERYKSKNFIDTAIYRGGDAVSGWAFAGLFAIVGSISLMSYIAVPLAMLWVGTGLRIGKLFNKQTKEYHEDVATQFVEARST